MNKERYNQIIDEACKNYLQHLSFWHNKTDEECVEMAKDENGNLDAEQALLNMLERDICTGINNEAIKDIKKWIEDE